MKREEAIKLIEHISIAFVPTDQYGDYDDPLPYEEALGMAIEALSADRPTGWIPCSERLPSEDGEYLVARGEFIYVYSYGIPLMPMNERNRRRGWYESTSEGDFYMDVDAWMPLPEPYKGGDDE